MQQIKDYPTQQTIIYKLLETSNVNQKQQLAQLNQNLYNNKFLKQQNSQNEFDNNFKKLSQLINDLGSNYIELQKDKISYEIKQSELIKLKTQAKYSQNQINALSFESSKKYDYKIRLKQFNESKRKQLNLILIEENRLKQQILTGQSIKCQKINQLNNAKNIYKQLLILNSQNKLNQINMQNQVNQNKKILCLKLEEINKLKNSNQKLKSILQAAIFDNQNIHQNKQKLNKVKLQKQNILQNLKEQIKKIQDQKQNKLKNGAVADMNNKQMKLNYEFLLKNKQNLIQKNSNFQDKIFFQQKQLIQIESIKSEFQVRTKQQQKQGMILRRELLDNFKHIQQYQELNEYLILQSRAILPILTQQSLQKIYYQRAKLYWKPNQKSLYEHSTFY